jgi:putative endonuclease
MYFTYIIQSESSGGYYVGHTDDIVQRLDFHNTGVSLDGTKRTLVTRSLRRVSYEGEAIKRESEIKRWKSHRTTQEMIDRAR